MALSVRRKAALATFCGSGSTTLIAALQSILLLPLYLRFIGAETYGVWLATGEILLWMVAFDCGIPNLMIQRIGSAHAQGRTSDIGRHFATCLALLSGVAIVLSVVLWVAAPIVAQMVAQGNSSPESLIGPLRLAALATGMVLLNYVFQGLARALQLTALPNMAAVVSTLAGFGTTYGLLMGGHGLQAIAIGLVVRSAGTLLGGIAAVLLSSGFRSARRGFRPSRKVAVEYIRETPLLLTSGLAYALMTNSQIVIANFVLGPMAAVLLSTARRLSDLIKSVLDMASYSTEGGLAHLFGSGDRTKAVKVLRELDERYHVLALAMLAGFVAVNSAFVPLWTSGQFHPGYAITIWIGARAFTTTWGYMGIARLRASGAFRLASAILLGDCACRILAMVIGATYWGLLGLCVGAALPSVFFGFLARTKIETLWGSLPRFNPTLAAACVAVGGASLGIGFVLRPPSWAGVIGLGLAVTGAAAAILLGAMRRPIAAEQVALRRAA